MSPGPRDRGDAPLEPSAQHLEATAIEFGEFVEEEDAVMEERDLARRRRAAAVDHAGVRNGVMR